MDPHAAPANVWRRLAAAGLRLGLALGCLAGPASAQPAPAPPSADQRALLTLSVNGVDQGDVVVVVRGTDVLVEVAILENAGLTNFQGRRETAGDRVFVSLESLAPTITFTLSEQTFTLKVTATAAHLRTAVINVRATRPALEYAHATSAFLNYGVDWTHATGADGSIETGLSTGPALALNTVSWDGLRGFVRGSSSITFDQPESLRRWTVGDSLISGSTLGSGMLLGGFRVYREYGLDPYFVQFPTMRMGGTTLTPSIVEVYVNDRLVSRQEVAPGSFELANLPMVTGSNDARVVVRDAFGREQQMAAPFYLSTTVLAQGLQEYDYAVGYPRDGGAVESWNYGRLSVVAHHRYGFTDHLTAGFVAEGDSRTQMAGPTLNLRLPAGEVELAAAGSRSGGRPGGALAVGYAYSSRRLGLNAVIESMSAQYAGLSTRPDNRARVQASGMAGTHLGRISVSIQEAYIDTYTAPWTSQTSLIGSMALGGRTNVFVNASSSRQNGRPNLQAYAGLSLTLDPRTAASLWVHGGDGGPGATAEVQRSLPMGNGYGYQASADVGGTSLGEGILEAQGPYGRYEVGQEIINGESSAHASVMGGLVAIGGDVHATRPLSDSFALVRVPDVPGVRAYLNNQEMGRTDGHGNLLISDLLPYYANRIDISDQDVPMDHDLEGVEQVIAPPYRGGAVVVFKAARHQGLSGTMTLGEGGQTVLPAFGEVSVSVGNQTYASPIGHDGEFYLENVPPGSHPAVVQFKGAVCQFTLTVPASTAPELHLGIVRCDGSGGK
jgi:outer membrane usher protein